MPPAKFRYLIQMQHILYSLAALFSCIEKFSETISDTQPNGGAYSAVNMLVAETSPEYLHSMPCPYLICRYT